MADPGYTEEWRAIEVAPDYEVSNYGGVRRVRPGPSHRKNRTLNPNIIKGHYRVSLCANSRAKTYSVHRLVAHAFLAGDCTAMVCHRDGNGLNNRVSNLYYGTAKSNAEDARRHGALAVGSRVGPAKLTEEAVAQILAMKGSCASIARKVGMEATAIVRIRRRKTWKHVQPAS